MSDERARTRQLTAVDALVIDPMSTTQIEQLRDITAAILSRLDPEERSR
jgi:hypothetical protein